MEYEADHRIQGICGGAYEKVPVVVFAFEPQGIRLPNILAFRVYFENEMLCEMEEE